MARLIEAKTHSRTEDYSDAIVKHVWVNRDVPSPSIDHSGFINAMLNTLNAAQATICISVHSISVDENLKVQLTNALVNVAKKNVRVYLLTDDINCWGKSLDGFVLMRESKRVPKLMYVLSDPPNDLSKGIIYTGNRAGMFDMGIALNDEQCLSLYRYFCGIFWNEAHSEKLSTEIKSIGPKPAFITLSSPDPRIIPTTLGGQCYVDGWASATVKNITNVKITGRKLVDAKFDPSPEPRHISFHAFDKLDETPFSLLLSDDKNAAIVTDELILIFQQEQIEYLKGLFDLAWKNAPRAWIAETTRKELADKKFRFAGPNMPELTILFELQTKELTDIVADLNTVTAEEENMNLQPSPEEFKYDGYPLQVKYSWTVRPPVLPAGAKKDPLYAEWDTYEKRKVSLSKNYPSVNTELEFNDWKKRIVEFMDVKIRQLNEDIEKFPAPKKQTPEEKSKYESLNTELKNAQRDKSDVEKLSPPKKLPTIGELYIREGKRYLVVKTWEDVTSARKVVSDYTNAKICIEPQ